MWSVACNSPFFLRSWTGSSENSKKKYSKQYLDQMVSSQIVPFTIGFGMRLKILKMTQRITTLAFPSLCIQRTTT